MNRMINRKILAFSPTRQTDEKLYIDTWHGVLCTMTSLLYHKVSTVFVYPPPTTYRYSSIAGGVPFVMIFARACVALVLLLRGASAQELELCRAAERMRIYDNQAG